MKDEDNYREIVHKERYLDRTLLEHENELEEIFYEGDPTILIS